MLRSPPCWLSVVLSAALPNPSAAQVLPRGIMITGTPQTVWSWSSSPKCGGGQDFPDIPARPFMVGNTVRWFASNSGNYASVGTGGRDILATLQRGETAGQPSCVQSVASTPRQATAPYYPGSVPASYNTALWLASPFNDGTAVHALLHNEFHGDWTGDLTWCANQTQTIYLPCSYWNIVSASSSDGGVHFKLNQSSSGVNVPAIALAQPYTKPTNNEAGPQGMTAQSNILQSGGYYYVLALQLLLVAPGAASPLNGTCIWRAPVASGPLVWTGWDGTGWTVASPASYPATSQPATSPPLCKPLLPGPFRASWTFNGLAGYGVVVLGQDTLANMAARNVRMNGCPYAPGASASTADAAFTYIVATNLPITVPNMPAPGSTNWPLDRLQENTEICLLQINSINKPSTLTRHAYPSLLDPASATFGNGDLNFQFSGYLPYLYFTQMNPTGPNNPQGWDRDLVRIAVQVFPGQAMDAPIKGR